jgi:hypothetical protein
MVMVQECTRAVQSLLPELPKPERSGLAALVVGVVLAGTVTLGRAAAAAPGRARDGSKERRAQRLLANARFDAARSQRRLLRAILRSRGGRVDLLLDATTTGATRGQPGTQTVMLAVAWHRRALPLLWRSWVADAPGQDWLGVARAMLAAAVAALPPGTAAVVLADRGLSGARLARAARDAGCHYLLRAPPQTLLRDADGRVRSLATLAPGPGTASCRTGLLGWAPRTHHGPGGHRWHRAARVNAVAAWRRGDPEPWLLLTDLPATRARLAEYRRRTWEEELFRDLKSLGFQWDRSRVRMPDRVERLLLVLALAILWAACLAQRVLRRGWRRLVDDRPRRRLSYIQLGLRWLRRQRTNDDPAPCTFTLWRESTRPPKLS